MSPIRSTGISDDNVAVFGALRSISSWLWDLQRVGP